MVINVNGYEWLYMANGDNMVINGDNMVDTLW